MADQMHAESLVGHPPIAWLEKRAQELRRQVSERLAEDWQPTASALIGRFHVQQFVDKLPLPSGPSALTFNNLVTSTVLDEFVLRNTDPYLVTYLGSKVIEQTYYEFFDPKQPSKPILNLSVAKQFGTFFTPPYIAKTMVEGLARRSLNRGLVDPCAGSGVLLCSALIYAKPESYIRLVGVELDTQIAFWSDQILKRVAKLMKFSGIASVVQGDGLAFLLSSIAKEECNDVDVIINPPYGRLRVTKDRFSNAETAFDMDASEKDDSYQKFRSQISDSVRNLRGHLEFLSEGNGILEYSKLFFRLCAELTDRRARVAIISPDSWMTGFDGRSLRKYLIEKRLIDRIILIKEDPKHFATVNQATSITFLDNDLRTELSITTDLDSKNAPSSIPYDSLIVGARSDWPIPKATDHKLRLFRRLSAAGKFCDIPWCSNARGELDQTIHKKLFCEEKTDIELVRGEHLERFSFVHSSSRVKPSFVDPAAFLDFLRKKTNHSHFKVARIAGRQCSYAQQKRRLLFARVPPCHALGNSCNYLTVEADLATEREQRLYLLLGILNSAVTDWCFRIENSNNHVGNYELDNLPFPQDATWFDHISSLAFQIENAKHTGTFSEADWRMDLLEATVGLAYGLDPELELRSILEEIGGCNVERTLNYALHLKRGCRLLPISIGEVFYNHTVASLSDLDRQIISHVPEGGNWQNIPKSVPSKRLEQIREMTLERGGVVRTTYYGRLRRDQPAYTINTYFNRPGNGTHIHPVLDRTLTSREAARLQSFPDSYLFSGTEGAIRNQIGNAIPPLLAAAIGKKLVPYMRSGLCVDVFCGAGGLSLGLESVGWHVLSAIDNDQDALNTYCLNRPSRFEPLDPDRSLTSVYRRDLHERGAFEDLCGKIKKALQGRTLDLLVGGPPCQGFSHAGFRLANDKRNDLASSYLHFAKRFKPRIFILENVEGLLTFKNGAVLRDLGDTLREMGYRVCEPVWRLSAEQYGVPQMRRRIFLVATSDDSIDLSVPRPTHERCAGRRADPTSRSLFESTLMPPHTVEEALAGLSFPNSKVNEKLSKRLSS